MLTGAGEVCPDPCSLSRIHVPLLGNSAGRDPTLAPVAGILDVARPSIQRRQVWPVPSRKHCHIDSGVFTPVLTKHTKHLSLVDILSVGVDRMQRNFEPMRKQVEAWKRTRLPDATAKLVIYQAFIEGKLDAPKHLARRVHDQYFNPEVEEFAPRTVWSLSNAFTSAFKDLDPIPQFKTTAKFASFLELATASSN